jgi:hypothetical protein
MNKIENKIVRKKHKLKRLKHTKIAVFDVETWKHAKKFAFGVVIYTDIKKSNFDKIIHKKVFYDKNDMKEFLLSDTLKGYRIYAHNGSRFDYITLFDNYILDNTDILTMGSMIMEWKINERKFFDSFALLRTSVKKIGEALGLTKLNTADKFIEGIESEITQTDIDYCIRDCEIILKALINIVKVSKELNITIASQSMNSFKRSLNRSICINKDLDKEFIKSFKGGRVECFYVGKKEDAKVYDVNSMYPYVMVSKLFPDPMKLKRCKIKTNDINDLINCYEGIGYFKVNVKTNKIGVLPYRYNNRLCFPKGIFEGWYNFNELRYPLFKKYIDIELIGDVIISKGIEPPFKNFINDLYEQRKIEKSKGNEFYDLYFKFLMNSLYGKFGQKPKSNTYYFSEYEKANDFSKIKNINTIHKINDFFYVKVPNDKDPPNSIYSYASYVTSWARSVLFELMDINGFDNILYCDTDSIITVKEFDKKYIGKELGQLKLENEGTFIGIKAKFYSISDKRKLKGGTFNIVDVVEDKIMIDNNLMYYNGNELGLFLNEREKLISPKESIRNKKLLEKLGYFERISKYFDMIDTKRNFIKMNEFTQIIEL